MTGEEIGEWVVEACTSPGVRKLIWLGEATSAEDALERAHSDGNAYVAYLAKPNYVATGKIWPEVWESSLRAVAEANS